MLRSTPLPSLLLSTSVKAPFSRSFPSIASRPSVVSVQAASLFPTPPSVSGQLGSKYAVIEIGGAQQIVEEGRSYSCHRLNVPPGSVVKLPRVIALKYEGEFTIGEPYLQDVNVEAEIIEDYRGPKIIVFKYKPKKHYRKKRGHRQELTRFKITQISKNDVQKNDAPKDDVQKE